MGTINAYSRPIGSIIAQVSSVSTYLREPGAASTIASKCALEALTKVAYSEVDPASKIRFLIFEPGPPRYNIRLVVPVLYYNLRDRLNFIISILRAEIRDISRYSATVRAINTHGSRRQIEGKFNEVYNEVLGIGSAFGLEYLPALI